MLFEVKDLWAEIATSLLARFMWHISSGGHEVLYKLFVDSDKDGNGVLSEDEIVQQSVAFREAQTACYLLSNWL